VVTALQAHALGDLSDPAHHSPHRFC
jgi:hypothetical protein